jgi:hypothetical protein
MVPKVQPIITIAGTDASSVISPNLLTLTYKEGLGHDGGCTAMGDTVDLEFCDPSNQFRRSWSLANASAFNLSFQVGGFTRVVAVMTVKTIKIRQSKHRGTTIALSATSVPVNSHVRLTKKSRAWEKTDLKTIATQIASDNGLTLRYLPADNPKIDRVDQHDHSDAFMLSKLCSEHDFRMKFAGEKTLVIQDSKTIESAPPVGTFICPTAGNVGGLNGKGILDWEFCDSLEDVYSQCNLSFKDAKTGDTVEAKSVDAKMQQNAPKLNYHYFPHGPGDPQTGQITLE